MVNSQASNGSDSHYVRATATRHGYRRLNPWPTPPPRQARGRWLLAAVAVDMPAYRRRIAAFRRRRRRLVNPPPSSLNNTIISSGVCLLLLFHVRWQRRKQIFSSAEPS